MKKCLFAVLVCFGVFACSGIVLAQSAAITAKVPFAFSAGSSQFPAGQYTVSPVEGSNALALVGEGHKVFVPVAAGQQVDGAEQPQLTFDHYGHHYFLSQIFFTPSGEVATMPKSQLEIKLASRPGSSPTVASVEAQ